MSEGLIKNANELILKEVQSVVMIGYILAVAIGMLFTHQKYSEFGINIFDYADVFEFLIAPFSDLLILMFTLISVLLILGILKIDLWLEKKSSKWYSRMALGLDKKSWYNQFRYIGLIIGLLTYIFIADDDYGKTSKMRIAQQCPIQILFTDNDVLKGKMIEKTKEVIFLLTGEKIEVIPINSMVKKIGITCKL